MSFLAATKKLHVALIICMGFVAVSLFSVPARASLVPIGSTLTIGGTNLPGACTDTTCSGTVTFSSTPVLIDGGAISIFETQTATAGGGEWDVWHLSTTSGGSLAGDVNGDWVIAMDYTLSQAVNFEAVVNQWTVNGTPVSPLSNFGGICCATASNSSPVTGEAYFNSGFTVPLAAGVQSSWQQIFVDPYSFVSSGGIDASSANGYNFGLYFTPQVSTSTPEPSSLLLLGTGLLAFAPFIRRLALP